MFPSKHAYSTDIGCDNTSSNITENAADGPSTKSKELSISSKPSMAKGMQCLYNQTHATSGSKLPTDTPKFMAKRNTIFMFTKPTTVP